MRKSLLTGLVLSLLMGANVNALTYFVSSNGATVNSAALDVGVNYTIEVSGQWSFHYNKWFADAEYFQNVTMDWNNATEDYPSDVPQNLELLVDGQDVDWLGTTDGVNFADDIFSPTHVYRTYVTGTGSAVQFQIHDTFYGDNSGSLQVDVTKTPGDAVPEPATIFLVFAGLAGMAGFSRNKIKK
ncbi:MAG: PEP-CTERM sorting domain-containing protein [FCB group bacterium]|nr:PEP-CTERM sorting domain-containing protein [FCB group bacterium]